MTEPGTDPPAEEAHAPRSQVGVLRENVEAIIVAFVLDLHTGRGGRSGLRARTAACARRRDRPFQRRELGPGCIELGLEIRGMSRVRVDPFVGRAQGGVG